MLVKTLPPLQTPPLLTHELLTPRARDKKSRYITTVAATATATAAAAAAAATATTATAAATIPMSEGRRPSEIRILRTECAPYLSK